MPKNQLTKYYLNKWGYFDQNLPYLNRIEAIKMKILYLALKELEPEERRFLADKYRVAEKPIISDAVLAKRQKCKLKEYREKRITVESKLKPSIVKFRDLYSDEFSIALKIVSEERLQEKLQEKMMKRANRNSLKD